KIAMTGVCALHMFYRCFRSGKAIRTLIVQTPMLWMFLYALLAVVSAIWSDMPTLTAFRSVQFLVYFLLLCDALATAKETIGLIQLQIGFALLAGIFWELIQVREGFAALHSSMVPGLTIGAVFLGWLAPGRAWRVFYLAVV